MTRLIKNNQNISMFLVLVVAFLAALHGFYSYTVDSEIWSISSSKLFYSSGHHLDSLYSKPAFYALLGILHWLPLGNISHLYFAKSVFIINFFLLNFLFYKFIQGISKNGRLALLATSLLLLNPTWLAEGFRVRADLLAMTFSMFALNTAIGNKNRKFEISCLLIFFSFLVTPKSLVWNLPLLMFLTVGAWKTWEAKQKKIFLSIFAVSVVMLVIVYQSILPIRLGARSALKYFSESVAFSKSKIHFLIDFYFAFNAILKTKILWLLVAGSMIFSLFYLSIKKRNILVVSCVAIAGFLFVGFTPKTAFFFACFVLLSHLLAAYSLSLLSFKNDWWVTVAIALVCGMAIKNIYSIHETQNNSEQVKFIGDLESFVAGKNYMIFDSMGVLVTNAMVPTYVGSDDSLGNMFADKYLRETPPEVVLLTDRLNSYLSDVEGEVLEPGFNKISEGIYLRKDIQPLEIKITEIDPRSLFNQRLLPTGLIF